MWKPYLAGNREASKLEVDILSLTAWIILTIDLQFHAYWFCERQRLNPVLCRK